MGDGGLPAQSLTPTRVIQLYILTDIGLPLCVQLYLLPVTPPRANMAAGVKQTKMVPDFARAISTATHCGKVFKIFQLTVSLIFQTLFLYDVMK